MDMLYNVVLFPPLLLLVALMWFDSFSLVKKGYLALCFAWGAIMSPLCTVIGSYTAGLPPVVDAMIAQALVALVVLGLVRRKKAIFFIDAALYSVAAGAGFAVAGNIAFLVQTPEMGLMVALMRGLGTAIMYCGAAASTGVLLMWLMTRYGHAARFYPLAILPAVGLSLLYNSQVLSPQVALPLLCVGVVLVLGTLFVINEKSIGGWLEKELASEAGLLAAMRKGEFSSTHAGQYMQSVKENFDPETYLDMFCYVKLYLELSIQAKRNMMLAESGFEIPADPEAAERLEEFKTLRKRLGKTPLMVLAPIVRQERIEWLTATVK